MQDNLQVSTGENIGERAIEGRGKRKRTEEMRVGVIGVRNSVIHFLRHLLERNLRVLSLFFR